MDESRRAVLASAVLGLAGCMSGDSGVSYPGEGTTTSTRTATTTTTSTPQTTETTTEDTTTTEQQTTDSGPVHPLAAETERILDEVRFFADDYDRVTRRYVALCDQAQAVVEQVRRSSTLTATQLEKVRSATTRAADFYDEHLEPHFDEYGPTPEPHLNDIEKFARRGDLDRADEELSALLRHFRQVGTWYFVREFLSTDPIEDYLFDLLASPDDAYVVFGLYDHRTSKYFYAYQRRGREEYRKFRTNSSNDSLLPEMDAVAMPDGRVDAVSITVNRVPLNSQGLPASFPWDPGSFPSVPVFVQRYESGDAAAAAFETVVETTTTVESQTTLGRATWNDVYYYYDGDIQYAYVLRVGRVLLAMAPSMVPWEERRESDVKTLQRSWLWSK